MLRQKILYLLFLIPLLSLGSIGYVANYGSNTVSLFDTNKEKSLKTIAVGKQPHGTWLSEDNSHLYVANMGSNSISIINTATNKKVEDIQVGLAPVELVSANGYIYTADSKSNTVSIIDEKTFKFVKKISVGIQPEGMERSKDGNTIYVSNSKSKSVTVINTKTQTVTKHVGIGTDAHNLRLSHDGSKLYVSSPLSHKIIVIDTKTFALLKDIDLEKTSEPVELLTNNTHIYVSCVNDGTLYKIDANTHKIISKLTLGGDLHGLSFYKENEIILSHSTSNTIALVSIDKMLAHGKINVGLDPRGGAIINNATSFAPSNTATGVSISTNLVLTLFEAIKPAIDQFTSSSIALYKTSDNSVIETFNINNGTGDAGGSSTIAGMTLTLDPNASLEYSTAYYVQSVSSYIYTISDGYFSIQDTMTWTFTTEGAPSSPPSTVVPVTISPVVDPAPAPKPKLKNEVTIDGVTTRVLSEVSPNSVVKLKNGVLRTTAGRVDVGDGYYFTAVVETTPEGKVTTAFYKISETDPTDVALVRHTYTQDKPLPLGSTVTIKVIDEKLYIIISSPLNGTTLIVQ